MRLVIDTCCLQDQRLDEFLSRSDEHIAVLTDFTIAEMFKTNALINAVPAWTILSKFPEQVVILKPLEKIVPASTKRPCLANRFVAKEESKGTANFSAVLSAGKEGNSHILRQLNARTLLAEQYMRMLRREHGSLLVNLQRYDEIFLPHERKLLRNESELPPCTVAKFIKIVNTSARKMMFDFDPKFRAIKKSQILDHFCYRYSWTYHCYVMKFYRDGMRRRKVSQAANDVVDIVNAALSTYFNGLLTNDALPKRLAYETRYILNSFGARLPKYYFDTV